MTEFKEVSKLKIFENYKPDHIKFIFELIENMELTYFYRKLQPYLSMQSSRFVYSRYN